MEDNQETLMNLQYEYQKAASSNDTAKQLTALTAMLKLQGFQVPKLTKEEINKRQLNENISKVTTSFAQHLWLQDRKVGYEYEGTYESGPQEFTEEYRLPDGTKGTITFSYNLTIK